MLLRKNAPVTIGKGLVTALALVAAVAGNAQSANRSQSAGGTLLVSAEPSETASDRNAQVLREIDDPSTGNRWLLLRDDKHPGGPGKLVLEQQNASSPNIAGQTPAQRSGAGQTPVIHAGDALIVEEHSAVVDLRLEAVALGPAAQGAFFKARLKIGGRVVHVVAVASGRAAFPPESETGP